MDLQRRPLYGIGTVARLTGVKPDTLRVWERRYQLGASQKTPSGRRLFTQADLEHLQLVAALVASGTRIGEIASAERKTLEVLLRSRDKGLMSRIPARKPRVLFVGEGLCDWLEEHQGFLVGIDALLAPCPLLQLEDGILATAGEVDGLVVEIAGSGKPVEKALACLTTSLSTTHVLVLHPADDQCPAEVLEQLGCPVDVFPPEASVLASYLSRCGTAKHVSEGDQGMGQLARARPRLFDAGELSHARTLRSDLEREYPRQLSDLVGELVAFEEHSARCSVENWQEASVHACVYAYAGQARWLMEKALRLVLEARQEESQGGNVAELKKLG